MPELKKILVIDDIHPILKEELELAGFQYDYNPEFLNADTSLDAYIGIVVRSKKITREIIRRAKNLKFIGRAGAGLENIDIAFAEENGIQCFNSSEGSRDAVGEHTVSLLLAVMNKIVKADAEVRKGLWLREANWGTEIKSKTIGIIGYGKMGSAFAEKISGFGAKVIAYDKYKFAYSDQFVQEAKMEQLFEACDILSLHVPLTDETHYLVNHEYLKKFRKKIVLLNTSRGKVVHTPNLVKALESGKVVGAGLDVLEYEKSAFEQLEVENLPKALSYLFKSEKVVLSPHVAGWTNESYQKLAEVLVGKIKAVFN
ncbi:MAG: phosphoglycerate dehydrogenase [Bacteroidetes bacterium]|nr:phosphoglycerate dehydrogenase [Bacteroidota bacterium]